MSMAAAESADLTRGEIVLSLFRGAGQRGLTRDQVALVTGWGDGSVCPRVDDLLRRGEIVETSRRRATRCGRKAVVLVVRERSV